MTSRFAAALAGVFLTPSFVDTSNHVKRLEATYRAARTMQVIFLEQYSENGRVIRIEAGAAYFRRPGKMRWEYQSPEKNLFLVDGKTAWFYVPADHTVTRIPAKQSTDWRTPLALLAGEMELSSVCARVRSATNEKVESPDNVILHCELRGTGNKSKEANASEATTAGGEAGEAIFFEIVNETGELVSVAAKAAPGRAARAAHTKNAAWPPATRPL